MLLPDKYTVIAILPISTSLFSINEELVPNGVYKALLQSKGNFVGYFVGLDFGPGSVIKIINKTEGLLLREDYEVILRKEYYLDKEFVSRMIQNKQQTK